MARNYSQKTIKILFALSGNRCAFPGCGHALIDGSSLDDDVTVLGEMCHIIASSQAGPRGAINVSAEAKDSAGNLVLLCPTHHTLVDGRPDRYPPETLRVWKAQREERTRADANRTRTLESFVDSDQTALKQLKGQLEGLSRRTLSRSEQLDDGIVSADRRGLRLSDSLYVERDLQQQLIEKLAPKKSPDRPVLVIGEPGVGKTSLLWSAISQAADGGRTAWLLDAPSLVRLFDTSKSPGFRVEAFARLCEGVEADGQNPLLAIDTADLCLNDESRIDRFTELLSYLQQTNVQLLIASRPQESDDLRFLNPVAIMLNDYSDDEFERAVFSYANAYLGASDSTKCQKIVDQLRESAAQGYPIREVALKPLTLRMLFSIYAPEDINHAEIDIVGLYDEFWRRRVQDDIRAGSPAPDHRTRDLSHAARILGVKMLGAGSPDISLSAALESLLLGGVERADLDLLAKRGVIQVSGSGRERLVGFFHQTFFEHAAAEAIASSPDPAFLQAIYEQFVSTGGNQFIGCVLERALVLAETRDPEVRRLSQDITLELTRGDEPYLSAGVNAFAHRRSNSPDIDQELQKKVSERHQPTIERLLAVSPNMSCDRRAKAVTLLGAALRKGEHRTNEKVFSLFERTVRQNPREVITEIKNSGLVNEFRQDSLGTVQSRMIFYGLAPHLVQIDPEWVFTNLASLATTALLRLAGEQDFGRACRAVSGMANDHPAWAMQFVSTVVSAAQGSSTLSAGEEETRA